MPALSRTRTAAASGVREAVHIWSDPTGRSYQDTSRWGVVQLVAKTEEPTDPGPDPTDPEPTEPEPTEPAPTEPAATTPPAESGGSLPDTGAGWVGPLAAAVLVLLSAGTVLVVRHRRAVH